jgi:hypothetical protein
MVYLDEIIKTVSVKTGVAPGRYTWQRPGAGVRVFHEWVGQAALKMSSTLGPDGSPFSRLSGPMRPMAFSLSR